jgi:serine/threonine protein kinase
MMWWAMLWERTHRRPSGTPPVARPALGMALGMMMLIMALLEGDTLRSLLAQGSLFPSLVVALGIQLARGLARAHDLGIVHRDLKPENLFLVEDDGAFKAKGKTDGERDRVLAEARAVAEAGAFCIVIEGVAESLAREITEALDVPTIGIGASAACDGQVLVVNDMLGMFDWTPKFVRKYADLRTEIDRAASAFASDVKTRRFPAEVETYFSKKPASQ